MFSKVFFSTSMSVSVFHGTTPAPEVRTGSASQGHGARQHPGAGTWWRRDKAEVQGRAESKAEGRVPHAGHTVHPGQQSAIPGLPWGCSAWKLAQVCPVWSLSEQE